MNATNDKIRYVAFRFFLERGYEATNIRDICKEVEIKASSLYFYYKSKEELFFSIYEEIWEEKIKYLEDIEELQKDISPDIKLHILFKKLMEYSLQDITKQKFLIRYHLFPAVDISNGIREKLKLWGMKENEIILDIFKQCIDCNILDNERESVDYLQEFKGFVNSLIIETIISSVKMSSTKIDMVWIRFWNCSMLKCI